MTTPIPGPDELTPALAEARRHRVGVRAAAEDLERALARASGGRLEPWGVEVKTRALLLRDAFGQHVATTEGAAGLFAEVLDHAPRLAHRMDVLRHDHVLINGQIDDVVALADLGAGIQVDDVREAALDLLGRISRHRHLGAELVYEAYTVDIEAAD